MKPSNMYLIAQLLPYLLVIEKYRAKSEISFRGLIFGGRGVYIRDFTICFKNLKNHKFSFTPYREEVTRQLPKAARALEI